MYSTDIENNENEMERINKRGKWKAQRGRLEIVTLIRQEKLKEYGRIINT